jgi:squalene-associated FAD-dependent desaturase
LSAPSVVVVGGGLAGMAAALECASAGAQVSLFERRAKLGGLTWSFTHAGLTMDNGQHVFLRCCTEYLGFLGRIGSAGDVSLQDGLQVVVLRPGGHRSVLRSDPLPAPLHLARSLLGYKHLSLGDRLRLGPAIAALARLDLSNPKLDTQSFASWLAGHHQRASATAGLWDLICLPTVNLQANQASLAMAAKVFQTGLLRERRAGDIGWSRVPLGQLHGERGTAALRRAGVRIFFGEVVKRVEGPVSNQGREEAGGRQASGAHPRAPRLIVRTDKAELEADAVVVALPHYCTEDVLPPGALGRARPSRLGSSPIIDVHVHFDRQVTDLPFAAGLGSLAQWIFDRTVPAGAERGQYLAVSISGADAHLGTGPRELSDAVVRALGELFPRARAAKVLSSFVTREHHATFRASPGSAADRAPQRTRAPGLAVAGAWTATGWPPTMEGAVRSGVAAARSVLEDLPAEGLRRTWPHQPAKHFEGLPAEQLEEVAGK